MKNAILSILHKGTSYTASLCGRYEIVVGHFIKLFLKKWWDTMLSTHKIALGHVPPGPTYSNTPASNADLSQNCKFMRGRNVNLVTSRWKGFKWLN